MATVTENRTVCDWCGEAMSGAGYKLQLVDTDPEDGGVLTCVDLCHRCKDIVRHFAGTGMVPGEVGHCPKACIECADRQHHFGEHLTEDAEESPDHPAARTGLQVWHPCKHCDAYCEGFYVDTGAPVGLVEPGP